MKIDASDVNKSVDEYRDIKYISSHISNVVSRGIQNLFECINYCVTEILRNVLEHSMSNTIGYAAQFWPSQAGGNMVEICIIVQGIGIQKSLKDKLDNDEDILKFSLVPGCSSKQTVHYVESAENAGFGLK